MGASASCSYVSIYELFVFLFSSSGVHFRELGSSMPTKPIHFRMTNNRIYSTLYGRPRVRAYFGILGIIAFILVFVVVAMKLYKRRATQKTAANGVAFENPSYLREISIDHIPAQVS